MSLASDRTLAVSADLLEWAASALQSRQRGAGIVRAEKIGARTGVLYRLHTATSDGPRRYFVKACAREQDGIFGRLPLSDLIAVSAAFKRNERLGFVELLDADSVHDRLLMAEAPGVPLAAYRRHALASGRLTEATGVWELVGEWLRELHSTAASSPIDEEAIASRVSYTIERFVRWKGLDPAQSALVKRAVELTRAVARGVSGASLVPCHGDVSGGNIFVDTRVTLIDFGDFRLDLPALDLSQAVMEIREYGQVGSLVTLPWIARASERRFRKGYGSGWPTGPAWWLPHLRNLSVYLVTLAPSRFQAGSFSRYYRTRRELVRTLDGIERGLPASD